MMVDSVEPNAMLTERTHSYGLAERSPCTPPCGRRSRRSGASNAEPAMPQQMCGPAQGQGRGEAVTSSDRRRCRCAPRQDRAGDGKVPSMTGLSSGSPRTCGTLIAGPAQERMARLELAKAHAGLQRDVDGRKRRQPGAQGPPRRMRRKWY